MSECVFVLEVQCLRVLEASDFLELEFQAIVNHLIWVLGNKLGTSARAVHALNH